MIGLQCEWLEELCLFIVCLSNLVDISSWPKLDFDFNLWAVFVISEGNIDEY